MASSTATCPDCGHAPHDEVFCSGTADCDCGGTFRCACSHPDPSNYAEVPEL